MDVIRGGVLMSDRMKVPKTNPCNFKMVSQCYYQDTSKTINQQLCSNCILARCEKHLFTIANNVVKNVKSTRKLEEGVNELSNRESLQR